MINGYRVFWTDNALDELKATIEYLQLNFSEIEVSYLARKIESILLNISNFPELYPASVNSNNVRRVVVARFNTMYYRINNDNKQIEILSFFSNRQNDQNLAY